MQFNVNGTHYTRTLHQRKTQPNAPYVIHNGLRYTVLVTRSGILLWAPWCDNNPKLKERFK